MSDQAKFQTYDFLDEENQNLYHHSIKALIKKALPFEFDYDLKKIDVLYDNLPIIKWSFIEDKKNISIILICKYRKDAKDFFYDMVCRFLPSQNNVDVNLFFSTNFSFNDQDENKLTLMQAILKAHTLDDYKSLQTTAKAFETEIRLGLSSEFHANRIVEFKGLSNDRKTKMVQEKINTLIQKKPKEFGKNIFSEMQKFLIMSRDEFKSQRDYHHISRIISMLYMIRKLIKQSIETNPEKRYLILKFLQTKIKTDKDQKTVLGVLVGLNFLKEHEIFEEKHLKNAIENFLPYVSFVKNSFFIDKASKNEIQTCYIEIEKPNGIDFQSQEIDILKNEVPTYLKGNIEQLIHPVFMPRNEEEIVKNMVLLSHELKFVHDIPQVIISFDKQTYTEISFNIILLRVLRPLDVPLKEIIEKSKSKFRFVIEKVKKVGVVRRKYLKEANVFSLFLKSSNYLRSDHSLDINKARTDVVQELMRLFGDVRDYNGGMIYKQNEAYKSIQALLGQIGKQYENLLEKFFYSIIPVEMTAIIKPDILKNLFLMLINAIKREESRIKKIKDFLFKQESHHLYIIIPIHDSKSKKLIKEKIEALEILSSEIISFSLNSHDIHYLGYVYINDDKQMQKSFFDGVQHAIK